MYDILELNDKLLADLRQIAKTLNIKRVESYKKQELIYKILDQQALVAAQSEPVVEPAAPEAAAPVEKREKKPRIRVVRPGVEKVGDSKGGVQKFARREEKKKGEVKKEEVKSEEIKNEEPLREEVKKETLKQEEPKKEEVKKETKPSGRIKITAKKNGAEDVKNLPGSLRIIPQKSGLIVLYMRIS